MGNLRDIVDGVSSLANNINPERIQQGFKVKDDVIVRRPTTRSGTTSEVMVGTILALGDSSATVNIKKSGGRTEKRIISLKQLSPVTLAFRRSSIQFHPMFRGRV